MTQQGQIQPGEDYTVQAGDTLSSIAQRAYNDGSQPYWIAIYWMNQVQIGNDPNVLSPETYLYIPRFAPTPQRDTYYIVKAGDTLSGIAQQAYGNSSQPYWTAIFLVNQYEIGNDPNLINPGEPLYLPVITPFPSGGDFYIVKAGDTLSDIAQQAYNDANLSKTIYHDNIKVIGNDQNLILPGQVLFIRVVGSHGGGGNIHVPNNGTWGEISVG